MVTLAVSLAAQTTQGVISGRLMNSITGRPVAGASIEYSSARDPIAGKAAADQSGYYSLPLLSPGTYRVRVIADGFQAQEVQELDLPVAGRIDLNFRLRPLSDVWEAGQYNSVFLPGSKTVVTYYGPDVDSSRTGNFEAQKGTVGSLETSFSEVIDANEIQNLPLQGNDVYTMLVTQPGVTSDAATARGLGLAVNGARPSDSNYMLDGLENNNYLITGPLVTVAPEAIQEYRLSTNNFSAEYGRTSGFVANAITRSGSNDFHGVAYFYLMNDFFNANGFQENLSGLPRPPEKQIQPGFVVGGPILKNRLFFSSSYEYFRNRGAQDPQVFTFPAMGFFNFAGQGSESRALLQQYAPPALVGNGITAEMSIAPPVEVDRTLAIERLDYSTAKDRIMFRAMAALVAEPDFIWSPYPAFTSPLHENTWSLALADTHTFRANLTNEARAGFSDDDLFWNRAHSEIPTLVSFDGVSLPGSPAFYAYRNANRSTEILDNLIWSRGRHQVTAGAGALFRDSNGFLTAGENGEYEFTNVIYFALDEPSYFSAAVDRNALPNLQIPNSNRTFQYQQYFAFVQDSFKLTPRLNLNYGLRYELFGAPSNTGAVKDDLVRLGSGSTLAQQLTTATLAPDSQIFKTDKKDWSVRSGAAYDLTGRGHTILRGGFGIFYDRPFDNLWENVRNNNFILPLATLGGPVNFLAPVSSEMQSAYANLPPTAFPDLTLMDPSLQNGRVYSYFAGVQERFSDHLTLETNALGSYGRNLITTDIVNRDFSTAQGRYNAALPDIAYRAAQGFSDYNALAAVLRYRAARGMVQATYTWSHSIDNQSEPLLGDFFNLNFTSIQTTAGSSGRAAFSEQFNPHADRGDSDFDQRHNLVLFGYWNLPRGFVASALSAFRSGFPYTVLGASNVVAGGGEILNNRPNLIGTPTLAQRVPVAGGVELLNPAAFVNAAPSTLGNLGRNSLIGPGFYNLDVSLARSFGLREFGRLTVRASAFNVLNHANLNNPETTLAGPDFGVAEFGRLGFPSGFPAVAPLNETPRQIQLSVRVQF
jgi:hypothetical protein